MATVVRSSMPSLMSGKVKRVMHEFKEGELRSGSKKGPKVKSRKQAIAIALSESRKKLEKHNPSPPYGEAGCFKAGKGVGIQ